MKGTLWYCRSLADIFSRRGAPMDKQLGAAVSQMEKLSVLSKTELTLLRHD